MVRAGKVSTECPQMIRVEENVLGRKGSSVNSTSSFCAKKFKGKMSIHKK
jgi:hypothetical protein